MARQTAIDTADDMRWLREVHLPRLPAKYKSAIIVGNEDWPDRIEVYERRNPVVTDVPLVFEADEEGVFKETKSSPKRALPHELPVDQWGAPPKRHHAAKKTPPAQLQREIDEVLVGDTKKKHWIVETIKDHGPGAYYRYSVTGRNLHQNGKEFSWSVPNLDNPEYDLSNAIVVNGTASHGRPGAAASRSHATKRTKKTKTKTKKTKTKRSHAAKAAGDPMALADLKARLADARSDYRFWSGQEGELTRDEREQKTQALRRVERLEAALVAKTGRRY